MQNPVDHKAVAENIQVYLQNHTFIKVFSLTDVCKILDQSEIDVIQATQFLTECKAKFKSIEIFKIIQHLKVVLSSDFTKTAELLSIVFKSLKSPVLKSIYQSYHELLSTNHAHTTEISRLNEQITILKNTIAQNRSEIAHQQGEQTGFIGNLAQKDDEIAQLKAQLSAKDKESDELRDKIDELFPQVQKKTKDITTLKNMVKKRDLTIKKQKEEINEYRTKLGLPIEEEKPEEKQDDAIDEEKKKKMAALKAKKAKLASNKQKQQQENTENQDRQQLENKGENQISFAVPKIDNPKKSPNKAELPNSSRRRPDEQQEERPPDRPPDTGNKNNADSLKKALEPPTTDSALSAANTNEKEEQKKQESVKISPPETEKLNNTVKQENNGQKTDQNPPKRPEFIKEIEIKEENKENNIENLPLSVRDSRPLSSKSTRLTEQKVPSQPPQPLPKEEFKENPEKGIWLMPPPLPPKPQIPSQPPPIPSNPVKSIDSLEIEEMHENYQPVTWTLIGNTSAVVSQNPKNFVDPSVIHQVQFGEQNIPSQPTKLANSLPKLRQSSVSSQQQKPPPPPTQLSSLPKPNNNSNLPKLHNTSLTSQLKNSGTARYDISFLKPQEPDPPSQPQMQLVSTQETAPEINQPPQQRNIEEDPFVIELKKYKRSMTDFDKIYSCMKRAVKEKDLDEIKWCVEGGYMEVKDDVGNTPLLNAAYKGDLPMVSTLVDCGANIMATNNNKWSALYWAVMNNSMSIIKYVCSHSSFDINIKNNVGDTALHLACNIGRLDVVSFLCRLPKINVEAKNNEGKTPMMVVKDLKAIGFWDKKKFKEILKDSGAKS
ncbi:hypothetical protein TVAG_110620 [Trichomonas vaginalis G3]|uniref:Uncharacterized protein n=1 Tax=Trichomonas vaginalis (strain ATCC PRA-98 / G3) TaxID=412133 RepID=A2DGR3_TRIV3|nr:protein ubiquitination [Trichomonas vaginalis G3]EAY20450.1 hypothetical protein TVAG_110620 [Trichomonas vaginalis G3]KAI5490500.1 protein ubiquitination [Trichomonas vaginalis G3]|eukprot:XP_001581436.1 hypothetical protein [Trichomonas vaginalis G3]